MAASKCNSATPLIPVPPKSLIFLHEWWLVKQRKGLAVGGLASVEIADRERVFLSSVIVGREETNVLHSEDGITILFRGFINTSRSSQNGVSFQVCQHFLVGFPHDWKKYSAYSFGDAFGDSSVCSKNICHGLGISSGNHSKQSQSTDNMECECNNTASQLQVGEKGISDVAVESQAGNKKSFMSMFDSNKCTSTSGKGTVKPLTSKEKMDRKEKQQIRQKIVLDASNSCNRMVTRSISKRSHTMPKEDEKATIATVVSPVRRSPRLYSRR